MAIRRGSGKLTRELRLGQHRKAETRFAARLSRRESRTESPVKVMVMLTVIVMATARVKAKRVQLTSERGMHCSLLGDGCLSRCSRRSCERRTVSPDIQSQIAVSACKKNSLCPCGCSFGLRCIFWQRVELATCNRAACPSRPIARFSASVAVKVSLARIDWHSGHTITKKTVTD